MPDQGNQSQGDSRFNFLTWLMGLLAGHPAGVNPQQDQSQPQVQPTPNPTPMGQPTPGPTPTPGNDLQSLLKQYHSIGAPTPTPSATPGAQSMAHPMMKLQMAKAGMPQGQEDEEENQGGKYGGRA